MAKVEVERDSVDIRVSLLERLMLAEKPQKVPLSRIRSVDPHPRLIDMMMHWSDRTGVWLCGVSPYEGHLIPSARNPLHTLALDLEEQGRIYVEVDDESTDQLAERIQRALRVHHGKDEDAADAADDDSEDAPQREQTRRTLAKLIAEDRLRSSQVHRAPEQVADDEELDDDEDTDEDEEPDDEDDEDDEEEDEDQVDARSVWHRTRVPQKPEVAQSEDHDLARLGGWLVAVGSLGVLSGTTIVASGAIPGLLAVGAGVACGVLGGVALAVVSQQQEE